MGVSGCGKSTIGKAIAERLSIPFFDADDFHPISNLEKMKNGSPLTDEDRLPWLEALANLIQTHTDTGIVLACSALKQRYRDILSASQIQPQFVFLKGSIEIIRHRMLARQHFMPPSLLQSQFDTLEPPQDAIEVNIEKDVNMIVSEVIQHLGFSTR